MMVTAAQWQQSEYDKFRALSRGDVGASTEIMIWQNRVTEIIQSLPAKGIARRFDVPPRMVVRARSHDTNHAFHLLMTVFTVGLWLPVWITVAIVNAVRR